MSCSSRSGQTQGLTLKEGRALHCTARKELIVKRMTVHAETEEDVESVRKHLYFMNLAPIKIT